MRLLLAEDEKELSDALSVILKHNNYAVDVVNNGADALYYLETENYDGAILDIMMPKMDGLAVLKKIREQGSSLPVLILTAKSDIDDCVLGLDCGADDYLSKPFAAKELLARIRSVTRRRTNATSAVLRMGNISLNCATFELTSPKGFVRLLNKEYQMFEMLIANPGQLISTERFMEKVWGYDSEAEINVVWVGISNLRRKLSQIDADIRIKATRNQGYSLEQISE